MKTPLTHGPTRRRDRRHEGPDLRGCFPEGGVPRPGCFPERPPPKRRVRLPSRRRSRRGLREVLRHLFGWPEG